MTPDQIKKGRGALGLTQGEFAQLVGVQRATVCQWECGNKPPRSKNLVKLEALLLNRWVNLTDREMMDAITLDDSPMEMGRKIEAKLKEKNT